MLIILSYLVFLSDVSGDNCRDKIIASNSYYFWFTFLTSIISVSNGIINFLKTGPIRMLPIEKYGGHLIAMLCIMTTIIAKIWSIYYISFSERAYYINTGHNLYGGSLSFQAFHSKICFIYF